MGVSGVGLSLRQAANNNANGIATRTLTADGKLVAAEVTWAELEQKVGLLTSFLERLPALRRGDRLGVLGRNSAEYLQLLYACADAGVIIVPLNTRWSAQELSHAVVDCGIKVMAVLDQDLVGTALELPMPTTTTPTPTPTTAAGAGILSLILGPHATDFRSASSTQTSELSLALSPEVSAEPSADLSAEISQQWRVLPHGWIDRAGFAISLERRQTDADASTLTPAVGDEAQAGRELDESRCRTSAENAGSAKLSVAKMADIYCIVHTSGSTGRSKGVALTHRGQILQAVAKCVHIGLDSSTTFLNVMPLFHVGGISASLAVTMVAGCHVFMPRFSSPTGRAAVLTGRVNYLVAVPTMLHMLINETSNGASGRSLDSDGVSASVGAGASPLAGVLVVVVGGQLMSPRLERLARDHMPRARFVQTYACTEAGSTITFALSPPRIRDRGFVEVPEAHLARGASKMPAVRNTQRDDSPAVVAAKGITAETERPDARGTARDSVPVMGATGGITAEHVEIRVVERERGSADARRARRAAHGVIGEVETRGPHVMEGYWGRPDLTAEALRPDGWLRTGDLGRLEEGTGRLLVVGRVKDMIKTGGENVHASEVEDVLLRHNWVAEAAAYGVNDEKLGEKVAASVVLDGAAKDQAGAVTCDRAKTVLDKFCGLHLSHYKRPRRIDVVRALPKNSAGKVLRHHLRASL